ncbi:MAG: hypothetical protein M3Q19_01010 [Pseudomonadota bacterium]|nr:hypothetical protein [Pseudomonadota bacterium]
MATQLRGMDWLVIVPTGLKPYGGGMTAALLRLLTLLALVLMPIGMTGTPAAASPMSASHHMTADHCDEQQPEQDQAPASKMDCAAMCTALPATDSAAPTSVLKPKAPRTIAIATPFDGIILEIATPPPKHG